MSPMLAVKWTLWLFLGLCSSVAEKGALAYTTPDVNDDKLDSYSTLVIIEHPSNATVVEMDPVTLNCKAAIVHNDGKNDIGIKSRDPVMIEWFHEGIPVLGPHGDDHRIVLPDGSLFFLRALRGIDDGNYWCVASNLNFQQQPQPPSPRQLSLDASNRVARSRNATLRVAYLDDEFSAEPSDLEADEGFLTILPCRPPDGYPKPMVTWKRSEEYVNLDQRIHINDQGDLVIQKLFKEDEGRYQCIVSNMAGTRDSTVARLHVRRPPYFTRAPTNATLRVGEDVILPCQANGDPPPKTRWRRIGAGYPPDGLQLDLPHYKITSEGELHIKHVMPEQDGFYECQAISVVGSNSIVIKVTVHEEPIITRRPVKEVVVPLDGSTILECNATGNPKPVLLWMRERDRTVLLPGDRTDTGLEVKGDGALSITNIRATSTYVCLVANIVGSAVARATVSLGTRMGEMIDSNDEPSAVSIEKLQGISPNSIKVSWELTSGSEANVDGFYILYRSCIGEPPGFTSITVLHAAATSYVVNRLDPFTPYQFMVIPFYRGLSGQPSALYKAQTLEARPLVAPMDLDWIQVNTSTVDVTWKPVASMGFRGLPLGYQVLILQAGGRLALNRSLPYENPPHLLMSNLEPRHTYYIQVAAFNSRGSGPFSETLEVRPEPSLAHLGAVAGIAEDKGIAWITPLIIGFVVVVALIATAALIYVRKAAATNATAHKFPVNLTPMMFNSGRGKKPAPSAAIPTFREFQLVSENHSHMQRRRSLWGLSNTLNRMWNKGRVQRHSRNGRGRRKSVHISHGLTSEEESDYACIDRSTHSITGYLNGRGRGSNHAPHHSTLSTCADSLSPYATTHVLHHHHLHHHHHHASKRMHKSHHQQAMFSSFHTLPRRQPHSGSLQPLSVTTFLVPSHNNNDPALSDPGGVATLGRRKRLSSSRLTEASDHIYAMVQPKDKRFSMTSSASLSSHPPSTSTAPNLLDLIPPPPSYPPPSTPVLSKRKQMLIASEASIDETSRLLMTDECDGSSMQRENGYAKLKRNKNKPSTSLMSAEGEISALMTSSVGGNGNKHHHGHGNVTVESRFQQHQKPLLPCKPVRTNEDFSCKPENSRKIVHRKLDQPSDLKAPDIVTWLPVLLTASTSNGSSTASSAKLTNSSSAEPQTKSATTNHTEKDQQAQSGGQKTLTKEDGLVFRSPEMKRSLQRQKKKKLSKSKKQNSPENVAAAANFSDSDSETNNSDSFYETLRRHQRSKRKNSLGHHHKK